MTLASPFVSPAHLARKLRDLHRTGRVPKVVPPVHVWLEDKQLRAALKATGVKPEVFARNQYGNIYRGRRGRETLLGSLSHHRWLVWAWLRDNTQLSLPQIGRLTGCTHSSVFSGLQRLAEMKADNLTTGGGNPSAGPHDKSEVLQQNGRANGVLDKLTQGR